MKKILLLPCMMACLFQLCAQPGPPPGPQPALWLTNGSHITTTGGAYIVLHNMNVINDGTFKQVPGEGFVKLTGGMNVTLLGSSRTVFDQLLMAKDPPSSFNLESDLDVVSKVNFSGGIINLGNKILDLRNTGIFSLESETSRAFTTGTGYVQASGIINYPSNAPDVNLGKLGAIITTTVNMGNTIIKRGHKEQTAVSGSNNSILRYYDIEPTNNVNLKATLRFHYFNAELNGIVNEEELYQWRSKDMVTWGFLGADSRSTSANFVEKMNHSKFERMTLAKGTAPAITCPANITTSANAKGCKASVAFAATATGSPNPTITYRIGNNVISSPFVFSKGTTTVTATASNGIAPNASCSFTVTVVCGPNNLVASKTAETETDAPVYKLSLSARPNPTGHYFTVDIKSSDQRPVDIRVMDALGRLISTQAKLSSNSTLFFGHKLVPGTYYMEAIQGKDKYMLKLIKLGN